MSHPTSPFLPPPIPAVPAYSDPAAILAGLTRQSEDLRDLADESERTIAAVSRLLAVPEDNASATAAEGARRALFHQHGQLVWLAADAAAMLAALAADAKGDAMSDHSPVSPVLRLYSLSESLRHLSETLPEDQAGLAMILSLIGYEVDACAEALDDAEYDNDDHDDGGGERRHRILAKIHKKLWKND